jgi:hypothetical protein
MTFKEVRAFKGTLPQRITEYHNSLDAFVGKKVRRRFPQGFTLDSVLMARAAAQMNIFAVRPVIMVAMAATHMVDRLAGEGFRRKSCPGDDDLSVFVLVSGICGLKTRHFSIF